VTCEEEKDEEEKEEEEEEEEEQEREEQEEQEEKQEEEEHCEEWQGLTSNWTHFRSFRIRKRWDDCNISHVWSLSQHCAVSTSDCLPKGGT